VMLPPGSTVTCVRYPFLGDDCVVLGEPDARCEATSDTSRSHFCDGVVRVNCYGPRPLSTVRCSTIEDCMASTDEAPGCK
jgi:hypothetical protein